MSDFGYALGELKAEQRVARKGWNGKGMWLIRVTHYTAQIEFPGQSRDTIPLLPWIGMKTADGSFVPWLASQTDILAEDWVTL